MSLDQNLFTLNITPREGAPLVVELVDPLGTVHYRKERAQTAGGLYEFSLFGLPDPLSESLLATVTAPSASNKHKTIELHNPSVVAELKHTGTFTFRWSFKWEEYEHLHFNGVVFPVLNVFDNSRHVFEWKREECFLIRKPDPPVLVAITKEPPGRIKTKTVQILDYNLKRFDIDDRKGLEIVILSALLSFQDYSDDLHGRKEDSAATTPPLLGTPVVKTPETTPPPELPPKPKRTGAEKVAEMQTGELGEVSVEADGEVKDYAQYCANLLEGDNMLFVVLRSSSPATVPKVLEIAHQTKRICHRAGLDEELHQYVQYDTHNATSPSGKKEPRVIKLDDDADGQDKYRPPESLTLHLSKIPMPELQPKAKTKEKGKEKEKEESNKDRKRREKEEEKERQKRDKQVKKDNLKNKGKSRARSLDRDDRGAESKRLAKKPSASHVPSYRVHPNQPSPSPSQLNNPAVYAAPKPTRPPRPTLLPSSMPGSFPAYATHQRAGSSPGPLLANYPVQRPVSAYGTHLGPPQAPPQQRSPSPGSLVNGLLGKLKAW